MRNVSKRWNAPSLCNVLRSCSVAQSCIVSNMAISSGCRNNGTVCDVFFYIFVIYVQLRKRWVFKRTMHVLETLHVLGALHVFRALQVLRTLQL